MASLTMILIVIFAACRKDDFVGKVGICPVVVSTIPANGATGVPVNQVISVTFNEEMNPATINENSFSLKATSKVNGTISYDGDGPTFYFFPATPLLYKTTYTGKVATTVKDKTGNALQKEYVWSFTTVEQFTVNVAANPTAGGTVSGGGTYDSGSTVTVVATTNSGYTFANWTEGTTVVSSEPNYTFTLTGNRDLVANFTENIKVYNITLSSNPANGGTTSGGGSFNAGTSITVKATPNSGFIFANWTENGVVVSSDANYGFTVNGNRNLVANFTEAAKVYSVAVSANPSAGGTVTGGGTFTAGSSVTVGATANPGYVFDNWTEGSTVISTNANYTFTISENRTLVANFTLKSFNIAVSANPVNAGTATGGGTFSYGSSVTVSATPNKSFVFSNWTEGTIVVSTDANYTFTISGNRNLVANFVPKTYSIAVSANPAAGGTVTGGGTYNEEASATVTATANAHYRFANWTEGTTVVSTNASYSFTVSANRTLVANFTRIPVWEINLTSTPPNWGTTTGGGSFEEGTTITVSANANQGYYFAAWTEGYDVVTNDASYTFTVTGNRNLIANFRETPVVNTLTLEANPVIGGTVSGGGSFSRGTTVTAKAIANAGYNFVNWTNGSTVVSTSDVYTFSITQNTTLVANFARITDTYCVLLSASPVEGGTLSGGGNYIKGTTATLVATALGDYHFAYWSENGVSVSINATYRFTVNENRTLVANFIKGPLGQGTKIATKRNQ